MGHAFICEYCECYHTVTDGCDEYDQNRANRIMVNNETQKENEMALEDVLAQKWIDSAKEIAELRAENGRRNYTIRRAVERAEKAERERDEYKARDQAEGGAASPAAFESDAVPDFPARGDNFDTVSRGVELGDWIPTA